MITGCEIDTVLSPEEEIKQAIESQFGGTGSQSMEEVLQAQDAAGAKAKDDVQVVKEEDIDLSSAVSESEKPTTVRLVDLMLTEALKKRASDIHIEPVIDGLKVRYRIDGALHEIIKVPRKNQNAITARLKIVSGMNITENRVPQDGRFKVKFEGKEIDFRVSCLPTTFGQKFVLRVLDKGNLSIGLEKLGFSERPLQIFKEAVAETLRYAPWSPGRPVRENPPRFIPCSTS